MGYSKHLPHSNHLQRMHVPIYGNGFQRSVSIGFKPRINNTVRRLDSPSNEIGAVVSVHNPLTGGALHTIKFVDKTAKKSNIKLSY